MNLKKRDVGMEENKKQWILGYMLQHKDESVDVVSESFVNAYVDKFNPETVEWSSYGAPKVFELGRLLANCIKKTKLADTGIIVRTGRTAIQNGFMFIIRYEQKQ